MFYTYVLQSKKDGKIYTGSTCDLRKRFKAFPISNGVKNE